MFSTTRARHTTDQAPTVGGGDENQDDKGVTKTQEKEKEGKAEVKESREEAQDDVKGNLADGAQARESP